MKYCKVHPFQEIGCALCDQLDRDAYGEAAPSEGVTNHAAQEAFERRREEVLREFWETHSWKAFTHISLFGGILLAGGEETKSDADESIDIQEALLLARAYFNRDREEINRLEGGE